MKSTLIVLLICLTNIFVVAAQDFFQLKNRWKPNEYIHVEQPSPASSGIQPGWWSAQWIFEPVPGTAFYKIKNRWRNQYLHVEQGPLVCGDIQSGWWSAQWQLEAIPGTSFNRLRNRWKPNVAIHNQNGRLEAGDIQAGWWSAQWELVNVGSPSSAPVQPQVAQQPASRPAVAAAPAAPVAPKLPSNRNANDFRPEHGGKVTVMFMRYQRVWPMGNTQLKVGDRIYFFPQRIECNPDGASFDPSNPALGGQTFTVKAIAPELELDRDIPMMRNRTNDSFSMIIEIY
ncbi:MAG: hypothetical protein RIB47_06035 [Cyclobacteriaceae bacterium]